MLLPIAVIRRESREPGMRHAFVQLRRAGFSRDALRPSIARRPVPSTTTDRIALARNAARSGARIGFGGAVRALLVDHPAAFRHRTCAAMVAATRAILKGVTSTGPCPYAANGIAAWISAASPAGYPAAWPFAQLLRADRKHAELREIGVARNRDGRCMFSVPCAESPTSSRIGLCHPGMIAPTRPSGSRRQLKLCSQRRIQPQRGHRGHQLEGRARRILAVARAVEQLFGRGAACGFGGSGAARSPSPAHRRSRVHHHHRAFFLVTRCQNLPCAAFAGECRVVRMFRSRASRLAISGLPG